MAKATIESFNIKLQMVISKYEQQGVIFPLQKNMPVGRSYATRIILHEAIRLGLNSCTNPANHAGTV
jgi:hypothetical protein